MPVDNQTDLVMNPTRHKIMIFKNSPVAYKETALHEISLNIDKQTEDKDDLYKYRTIKEREERLKYTENISTFLSLTLIPNYLSSYEIT